MRRNADSCSARRWRWAARWRWPAPRAASRRPPSASSGSRRGKFRYAPNLIELQQGEAVVLELTALDFTHGSSIPEWKVRADLVIVKA